MSNKIATTIKLDPSLYDKFKVLGIGYKLTLQGLIEKCVYCYVNRVEFRDDINAFRIPLSLSEASGSILS